MKRILMVLVLLVSSAAAQSSPAKTAYLLCGTLYDGKSDAAQRNVTVRIAGGKIEVVHIPRRQKPAR